MIYEPDGFYLKNIRNTEMHKELRFQSEPDEYTFCYLKTKSLEWLCIELLKL